VSSDAAELPPPAGRGRIARLAQGDWALRRKHPNAGPAGRTVWPHGEDQPQAAARGGCADAEHRPWTSWRASLDSWQRL